MNTSQKRKLNIFTDNVELFNEFYGDKLNSLNFVEEIRCYKIEVISKLYPPNDLDIYNAVFINNLSKLSHEKLIYIIKALQAKCFDLIYTDDYSLFSNCYKLATGNECGKHPMNDEDFFTLVQKGFTKKEINIGIISSNTNYMSDLYYNIINTLQKKMEVNDRIDFNCAGDINVNINSFMPKLIQGWIDNVWYPNNPSNISIDDSKDDVDDNIGKVFRVISTNLKDKIITYHFINPYQCADFTNCIDHFDTLYVDVSSDYFILKFGCDIDNYRSKLIPVSSIKIDHDINESKLLNIIANMIRYFGVTFDKYSEEIYHEKDKSNTIKVESLSIVIDNIYNISSICNFEEE